MRERSFGQKKNRALSGKALKMRRKAPKKQGKTEKIALFAHFFFKKFAYIRKKQYLCVVKISKRQKGRSVRSAFYVTTYQYNCILEAPGPETEMSGEFRFEDFNSPSASFYV